MSSVSQRPVGLRVLGGFVYVLWCAAVLGVGALAGWIGVGQNRVSWELPKQQLLGTPPQQIFHDDVLYMLILGCDEDRSFIDQSVTKNKARSDMMLVARMDFTNKRITGLSIPRDLLVQLPGYRLQKINGYHAIGGPELAERAAESVLGVPIDRTVVLDFEAFQRVVNLVGGVEIFVPKKMKWTDRAGDLYIDLKPGRQVLNGYNAMGFVRFRHADSDYERQKRQKEFMVAFKDAVMKRPDLLPAVANESVNLLGGGLLPAEVSALILFGQNVNPESIRMGMVPVTEGRDRRHGFYMLLDEAGLRRAVDEFNFKESPMAGTSGASAALN